MRKDLDQHAQSRVGTVINKKYRIERLIGAGGMASVYAAVHRNANRVAIKMLHPHLSLDADLKTRFLREGYVANSVDHRGAVRVLDDDVAEDGSVFLVMELLEGETLDSRCKRAGGRLDDREVCELARQLLDVLAAAHAKGIVHRDIKPENLFLTREGVLKVLDFGIARLHETTGRDGATRTGHMMGTPAFMPPEQALGRSKQIDGQTDVYAVGATMFTLISGHFVHDAETVEEMLIRAGSRPAPSVTTVTPQLAAAVAAVIDRSLEFEKADRWANARAMDAALADAYETAYGAAVARSGASQRPRVGPAATVDDVSARGERPRPSLEPPKGAARSGTQTATAWQPPAVPAHVISTTAGVASVQGSAPEHPAYESGRRERARLAVWGGLAAVILAIAGGGLAVLLKGGAGTRVTREGEGAGAEGASDSAVATHGSESAGLPAPLAPPIGAAQPTLPASETSVHRMPGIEPEHDAEATVATSRPAPRPAAAGAPPSAHPPVRPTATVNCDPPYVVLPNGHHQQKPECM